MFCRYLLFVASLASCSSILQAQVRDLRTVGGTVQYIIPEATDVTIELCDASGKFVAVLFAGSQSPGQYRFSLSDVRATQRVPAGQFTLSLKAGTTTLVDRSFGENGHVQLGNPCDVETVPDGGLFVLERKRVSSGKAGVLKLTADGRPGSGFGPDGDFVELPVAGDWLAIDNNGSLCVPCVGNIVQVLDRTGKPIHNIHTSAPTGGAIGPDGKLYLRTGYGKGLQVFDAKKPGSASPLLDWENLKDGPVLFRFAPILGLYAGPSMATGMGGKLYLTEGQDPGSSRGTIVRLQQVGDRIERRYFYQRCCKDCIGLALDDRGMIYVTERGTCSTDRDDRIWQREGRGGITPSTLYLLWDNDEQFNFLTKWEFPELKGLRDVAVAPDGSSVYLLEDADNFAIFHGEMKSPTRDLQGLGRLWKYKLSYRQTLTIPVEVK